MKNTEIENICRSSCDELQAFISLTKQLLEKQSSYQAAALNNYITQIYEISGSKALPQLISLFEKHSDSPSSPIITNCQTAIKQLNIFYNEILPLHISELSKLPERSSPPRELLTGFIRSTEIIQQNLNQCY